MPASSHRPAQRLFALRALYVEYALNAVGLVPHMIFFVDFVARGLGRGLETGAEYWVLFGLGAMAGPVLAGFLADRVGFGPAVRLAFAVEAVAVALPALQASPASLVASSLVVGALIPGIVTLTLGRIHELVAHHPSDQKSAWGMATTGFAIVQAAAAYGMSYLFSSRGDYDLLFWLGASAMILALAIDVIAAPRHYRPS